MHPRERVIRDRFAGLACAHCGASYAPSAIVVLARRRTKWMVLACCHSCERQAIFVVTFPEPQSGADTEVHATSDSPIDLPSSLEVAPHKHSPTPRPPEPVPTAVSIRDVNAMHEFLTRFDGNFQTLFAPSRKRPSDDTPA
ncbi:MAG TPA: hypothetical protein VJN88_13895 [Ktedonobacterales bacterium]|nr:hypothetical protein [Ktedonobacterales bacterium]